MYVALLFGLSTSMYLGESPRGFLIQGNLQTSSSYTRLFIDTTDKVGIGGTIYGADLEL